MMRRTRKMATRKTTTPPPPKSIHPPLELDWEEDRAPKSTEKPKEHLSERDKLLAKLREREAYKKPV
jgi:hypothetical protein